MHDVFISYSTENQEKAEKIRKILEANGISCWYAPLSIRGHQNFTKEIPQAIRGSKAFLLLMSESAQQSKWVERELGAADKHDVPIYTLFLEDCTLNEQFDFVLHFNQHYDISLGEAEQHKRLIRELKEDLQALEKQPPKETKTVTSPKAASGSKKWLWISVCALVIVSLLAVVLLTMGNSTDGDYVIWNPKCNVVLSGELVNSHYLAGESVSIVDSKPSGYSDKCVWKLTFHKDGTVTISRSGLNLGVEIGYNGIGMGGNYTADQWELVEAGDGCYMIKNVKSGAFLEWYADKNNWSTHDKINDSNRELFLLKIEKVS